ncbi:MAG: hypothetical protein ABI408_06690 [Gemmatimonadaceae bacterium]
MSIHERMVGDGDQAALRMPGINPDVRDSRESRVHDDLERRLKSVCGALGNADFEALLVKMTIEQLRGERYRRT